MLDKFNVGLATATIIAAFWSMGLRNASATDTRYRYSDREYLLYSLCLLIAGSILTLSLMLTWGDGGASMGLVLTACLALKTVDYVFENGYGLLQRHSLEYQIAASFLIRAIALPTIFIGLFYVTESLAIATFGSALGLSVLLGWEISRIWRLSSNESNLSVRTLISSKHLWQFATTHMPLGFSLVVGTAAIILPRVFSTSIESSAPAAAFALFYILFQTGSVLLTSFLQFYLPRLARWLDEDRWLLFLRDVTLIISTVAIGSTALVVIVTVFGQSIFETLYGDEIAAYAIYAQLLCVGWGFRYVANVFQFAIRSARQFQNLLFLDILSLVYIGLCFFAAVAVSPDISGLTNAFLVSQGLTLGTSAIFFILMLRRRQRAT